MKVRESFHRHQTLKVPSTSVEVSAISIEETFLSWKLTYFYFISMEASIHTHGSTLTFMGASTNFHDSKFRSMGASVEVSGSFH